LQYFTGRRVADVDDLILNTAGGVLGYRILSMLKAKSP
jgi:glycopeptide antibiotics resistance protein